MMRTVLIFAVFFILVTSCTQRFKNRKIAALRLKDFIETSLSVSQDSDRLKLIPFLTGQLSKDIATMEKDTFSKSKLMEQIKSDKII